ncbi:hypothetical protein XA68_12740 [Ophiocordyceps unilateralis]|uniref:Uncharacterized protein n=1 Tax=Ophiocordyceps unilateralis TaxID=268505 RepID=A0A2A9PEA6_OPHUN|nr:hypothetical protein XA68_12740 [Ophiocordyceps unilateralis]
MTKKKPKQSSAAEGACDDTKPLIYPDEKKSTSSPKLASVAPSPSSLIICRNKHWRHISSFHGAWLQIPTEILETIANINYNTLRPRPIDPAILFDLIKIRKNVDEASDLAVRAASDTASPTLSSVNGGLPGVSSMNAFGLGLTGHETRQGLPPRRDRLQRRDHARRLHLGGDRRIPSRQLAESTSLRPLQDIISARAGQAEVLRTLATVKIFKDDLEGAAQDLTEAMAMARFRGESHRSGADAAQQAHLATAGRRRPPDVILSEDEQPSGLESQLLFQRGCVYLSMASQGVPDGIPYPTEPPDGKEHQAEEAGMRATESQGSAVTGDDKQDDEALAKQAEARKFTKSMAKRALRDLMAFLAQFDYAPDLPVKLNKEFNERVFLASQGVRSPRCTDGNGTTEPHTVYSLPELFAAVPPARLPPYPNQEVVKHGVSSPQASSTTTCEWVTYHPLLTEALHSLLLSHCLAQTSAKELQRHAYMVARLVRLCDGYPVFQASRSPARTDWVEVLRRTKNWLNLCSSWETLCFPAPLPVYDALPRPASSAPNPARASAAAALINGAVTSTTAPPIHTPTPTLTLRPTTSDAEKAKSGSGPAEANDQRPPVSERQPAAQHHHQHHPPVSSKAEATREGGLCDDALPSPVNMESAVWWASEVGKDYPVASDRSVCVAQWILDAPPVTGAKRRKRVKKAANKSVVDHVVADELVKPHLEEE